MTLLSHRLRGRMEEEHTSHCPRDLADEIEPAWDELRDWQKDQDVEAGLQAFEKRVKNLK